MSTLPLVAAFALGVAPVAQDGGTDAPEKIGIFDLAALGSVPLEPQVVARSVEGGIVTEAIRFTSEPGFRPLMILSYKQGLMNRPGIVFARRFGAEARTEEAKAGFVGISIAPPAGNGDPARLDAVGGSTYDVNLGWRQFFTENPEESLLYRNVVALSRGLDYLATRPEIDLSKSSVMGTDWAGAAVALLHALDDRPASFFVWNGMGFYSDVEGHSGGRPAPISRVNYERYAPAAYSKFGRKPIFIGNSLNAPESRFDALFEFAKAVRSPVVYALAPNREIGETNYREFAGSSTWQAWWTNPVGATPPVIGEGRATADSGRLRFEFPAENVESAVALVSYGAEGNWSGRTWHRVATKRSGDRFVAEIPVYRLDQPLYLLGQASAGRFGSCATAPIQVVPSQLGVTSQDRYPNDLLRWDDFYVSTGTFNRERKGPGNGPSARILPHWDGRIRIRNVQPALWLGAKELLVTVKGDEELSTLNVYFGVESSDRLDSERENYTMRALLSEREKLGTEWRTFRIPLDEVYDLERVDSLFFETGGKPLQLAALRWQ
jgi:hypothetical protein